MKRTILLVLLATACGEGSRVESDGFSPEPPPASKDAPPPGFVPPAECLSRKPPGGPPVVYAHAAIATRDASGNKVWKGQSVAVFDPDKLAITEWIPLGACDEAGGFVDMAVDAEGRVFMAGANGLYRLDPKTHACTTIRKAWEAPNAADPDAAYHYVLMPNNLTFAPANLFDAAAPVGREVLVGFGGRLKNDTDLKTWEAGFLRIDPDTGNTDILRPWVKDAPEWSLWPSGDLATVVDACKKTVVTWATVIGNKEKSLCRACEGTMKAGLDCGDCLYEFEPKTGKFGKNYGLLPYSSIFGLTFWGGTLVGFDAKGNIFTIDPTTSPPTTKEIPVQLPPGVVEISFMGAGSTTLAPIGPR